MRRRLESFLRLRYTVPLLIAGALLLAAVNEWSHVRTVDALARGIGLTEARIGSARMLQLLTDAETAQRGYLLTRDAAYLQPMRTAASELEANSKTIEYLDDIGPTGPADAREMYAIVNSKLSELGQTVALGNAGQFAAALEVVQAGEGKRAMDRLRAMFDRKLAEAASLQDNSRNVIFSSLSFQRSAILLLAFMVALGLYLHHLQLQRFDRETALRQQLLEEKVAEQTSELRDLAGHLQTVSENEKSHLARELHDELGSLLTAAKLTLVRMRDKLQSDSEMLERIENINSHLSQGIALKRRIIEDLRPSALGAFGLNTALSIVCSEFEEQLGVPVKTSLQPVQINATAELCLYRVVQEALTNIGKHAKATEISVSLQKAGADDLLLEIADDGVGFDVSPRAIGTHGLAGIKFRIESLQGQLVLASSRGYGTRISARLPQASLMADASESALSGTVIMSR